MTQFKDYPTYPLISQENGVYKTNLRIKDDCGLYWVWPVVNPNFNNFIYDIYLAQNFGIPQDIEDINGYKLMAIDDSQENEKERLKRIFNI